MFGTVDKRSETAGDDFARLLMTHDRELRGYVTTLIPRRDDAEEVLQRTAVVLWQKFEEFDPEREFLPWALRFAYFEVLNFRKELARTRLVYSEEAIEALAKTRDGLSEELRVRRSALRTCLAELDEEDRSLLERRYAGASTVKALAEETSRTVKALYRRLDRIRDALARCVDRHVASSG